MRRRDTNKKAATEPNLHQAQIPRNIQRDRWMQVCDLAITASICPKIGTRRYLPLYRQALRSSRNASARW